MNLRRLKYFVKIVDIGSLTQAADVLHIAQPALSQQLATLEGEVRQQLLLRTKRGVTPTEAGMVLYRHAQLILRQCGYGGRVAVHGLQFLPLLKEQLYVVGPGSQPSPPEQVPLRMLGELDLYLARPYNVVRRMVDEAFAGIGLVPRVVAEIESASTLTAVIADGLGATILPESMARTVVASCHAWQCRIVEPVIEAPLALCQSDHLPLTEPAQAIKEILLELVATLPGSLIAGDDTRLSVS